MAGQTKSPQPGSQPVWAEGDQGNFSGATHYSGAGVKARYISEVEQLRGLFQILTIRLFIK
jgi:hypothetical protein